MHAGPPLKAQNFKANTHRRQGCFNATATTTATQVVPDMVQHVNNIGIASLALEWQDTSAATLAAVNMPLSSSFSYHQRLHLQACLGFAFDFALAST